MTVSYPSRVSGDLTRKGVIPGWGTQDVTEQTLLPSASFPVLPECTVHQRQQIIRQQNCSSEGPVSLSYCQGNCGDSTSMYVWVPGSPEGVQKCYW